MSVDFACAGYSSTTIHVILGSTIAFCTVHCIQICVLIPVVILRSDLIIELFLVKKRHLRRGRIFAVIHFFILPFRINIGNKDVNHRQVKYLKIGQIFRIMFYTGTCNLVHVYHIVEVLEHLHIVHVNLFFFCTFLHWCWPFTALPVIQIHSLL